MATHRDPRPGTGAELDAGLDAGLETDRRWTVALLAAAPWLISHDAGVPAVVEWLLLAPWCWAFWAAVPLVSARKRSRP